MIRYNISNSFIYLGLAVLLPASVLQAQNLRCQRHFSQTRKAFASLQQLKTQHIETSIELARLKKLISPIQSAFTKCDSTLNDRLAQESQSLEEMEKIAQEELIYSSPDLLPKAIEAERIRLLTRARVALTENESSATSLALTVCSANSLCVGDQEVRDQIEESIRLAQDLADLNDVPFSLLKPEEKARREKKIVLVNQRIVTLEQLADARMSVGPTILCSRVTGCFESDIIRDLSLKNIELLNQFQRSITTISDRARANLASKVRSLKTRKRRAQKAYLIVKEEVTKQQRRWNVLLQELTVLEGKRKPLTDFEERYPSMLSSAQSTLHAAQLRKISCLRNQ